MEEVCLACLSSQDIYQYAQCLVNLSQTASIAKQLWKVLPSDVNLIRNSFPHGSACGLTDITQEGPSNAQLLVPHSPSHNRRKSSLDQMLEYHNKLLQNLELS